jgi:hypothetical protein
MPVEVPAIPESLSAAVCANCGQISGSFWLLFGVIPEVLAWKSFRRYRRAMKQMREGSIADVNWAFRDLIPWEKLSEFVLSRVDASSQRLRIDFKRRFFPDTLIDAEIRCTQTQADELEKLLWQWITEANSKSKL